MTKLYKILDYDNTVVRIFSYKEEAEHFAKLDRCLRIETIKVFRKQKSKDNYTTAYELLGQGIV
jgi:hypothetical protein